MIRRIPIAVAGTAFTVLNFLIAILVFWLVLDPSNRIGETTHWEGMSAGLTTDGSSVDLFDVLLLIGAFGAFVIPLFALIRARSITRASRHADWALSLLALGFALYWTQDTIGRIGTQEGLLALLPASMMSGCFYAMIVYFYHGCPKRSMSAPPSHHDHP